MASYRIDHIASLARQLAFTPAGERARQVGRAEELLAGIDPQRAYPLAFVVYRITGFRAGQKPLHKGDPVGLLGAEVAEELLTGIGLQHDLGVLVETVSDGLNLRAADFPEPVLGIEDVADRFGVTGKTIQRWRRKGLAARRFIFPDGKKRVGFRLACVEAYMAAQGEAVPPTASVDAFDPERSAEIVRRARRLAAAGLDEEEVARRVAKRTSRTPLAVKHVVRKFDAGLPASRQGEAVGPLYAAAPTEAERAAMAEAVAAGATLAAAARGLNRPRAAALRLLLENRVERLAGRRATFIDDPLYHQPTRAEAEAVIDELLRADPLALADGGAAEDSHSARPPRDLPPYLAALYRTPLLTPGRERALFLAFNFHKYQFAAARRRLEPRFARARDLAELELLWGRAVAVKNRIVQANLRLVVSVARKHLRPGLNLMELVSDGNLVLMRAAEGFDVHRGNRFSTYATLALMKGFARSVPAMQAATASGGVPTGARRERGGASGGIGGASDIADPCPTAGRLAESRDEVRRLLASLTPDECRAVCAAFGVDGLSDEVDPPTAGDRLRQIERAALAKLRQVVGVG